MAKPLYMGWKEEFSHDDNLIVDEQHRGVLATINSLYYFLQQGHGIDALLPTIKILLQYMQFHTKTEEGILRDNGYPAIDKFVEQSEQDFANYKKACREALACKDPQALLIFLRDWWVQHMQEHQQFKRYMKD